MGNGSRTRRTQSLTDPSDFVESVRHIPIMQDLSDATCNSVCNIMLQIAKAYELSDGEVLYRKGEEDENTGALLVSGKMRIKRRGIDPIFIEPPELLGEMSRFSPNRTRSATVIADEDSIVLEFSWSDFDYFTAEQGALKPDQLAEFKTVITNHVQQRRAELGPDYEDEF